MNIIQFELLACINMYIKPPSNVYRNFFFKPSSYSMKMHSNLSRYRWLIVWTHCSRCTNCGRHSTSVIRSNRCSTKCPESIPFHPNADYWLIVQLLWILMINSEGSNSCFFFFFEIMSISRYILRVNFWHRYRAYQKNFHVKIVSHLHTISESMYAFWTCLWLSDRYLQLFSFCICSPPLPSFFLPLNPQLILFHSLIFFFSSFVYLPLRCTL